MKKLRLILARTASVLATTFILHAQETANAIRTGTLAASPVEATDLDVMIQAITATKPMSASAAPEAGNFYTIQHGKDSPPLPADILNLPFWSLGDGFYLLDDRALDYDEMAADSLMPIDDSLAFQTLQLTTNDLWLEITGTTNFGTNLTANLTIHPPWNVTNVIYGLYFKTNLAIPYNWTWLLTCVSGQTNLVASNLPSVQGFFMLGDPTAIRDGFTNNSLGPNDDDSYITSGFDPSYTITNLLATIGFPINFFGTSYTNLYVNNNGNVTFDDFLPEYTPTSLIDLVNSDFANNFAPTNIIAPFWADVDTRGSGSGVVTYGSGAVDGRTALGINWIKVGYFGLKYDKLNSFQLVLINRSDRTNGDFDLEFNYSQIQWETGDLSGGHSGFGGSSARAGYASASGSTFEMNGSGTNSAFLDTNTVSGLIYTNFNSTVPGRYVFQFHNGVPLGTP